MNKHIWSFILQWSRFGINAAVFLFAARFLSLQELGIFATAYAPIKLAQSLHKSGIIESVVLKAQTPLRLHALFTLSIVSAFAISIVYFLFCWLYHLPVGLSMLGFVPVILGFASVSDGLLRKHMAFKALAIRTAIAQTFACAIAIIMLLHDFGISALVAFVLISAGISGLISLALAKWRPSSWASPANAFRTSKLVMQITARDLVNASILPLAQIAIAARFGMVEAGAFHIAQRALAMFDALTLAPLRLLALPEFKRIKSHLALKAAIQKSHQISLWIAGWVWFGLASSATAILNVAVGPAHAFTSTPYLQALIPLGLSAAIAMPFIQGLLARGHRQLVFLRAIILLLSSVFFSLPMFFISSIWVCLALSFTNLVVLMWLIMQANERLNLSLELHKTTLPVFISGAMMCAIVMALQLHLLSEILIGSLIYISLLFCSLQLVKFRSIE